MNKLFKQRTHLANLDHMIDLEMIEGALRHLRIGGILRLLDHGDAPTFLDRPALPKGRLLSECIALAEARGTTAIPDEGFMKDVAEGIAERSKPWDPPTWE